MEPLTVEQHIWIAAPRERVWPAITQTDHIKMWWGDSSYGHIHTLQVGAPMTFGTPAEPIVATMLVVVPPAEFAFQWPPHPRWFSIPMVTHYRLAAEAGGTRVTVTEAGFEQMPDDARQARFQRISAEYASVIRRLKRYVEGDPLINDPARG